MNLLLAPDQRRYSRKSITWFVCLVVLMIIIAVGSITGNWPPEYIYDGLLMLIGGVLFGTIIDKKFTNNATPPPNVTKDL